MQVLFEGWTLASDGFLGSTAVHRVASGVWADLTRDSCSNVEGGEEDEANYNQLLRTAVADQGPLGAVRERAASIQKPEAATTCAIALFQVEWRVY